MSSSIADLGFAITNLWNVNNNWQYAFYGHIQPLMLLFGILCIDFPAYFTPYYLLFVQVLFIVVSIFAIYKQFGVVPAVAMVLYYPVWVNALFDFHIDFLAIPILVFFFIMCERRHFFLAMLSGVLLSLIKEPFALQSVACGLYLLWLAFKFRRHNYSRSIIFIALTTIILGCLWFAFSVTKLLPFFANDFKAGFGLNSGAFVHLGNNLYDYFFTIVTQPFALIADVFTNQGKLLYLLVVFGLLGFIPLIRPAPLIVALPLLLISMLSSVDNYYSYAAHYTAGIIVPFIVAFAAGVPVARVYFSGVIRLFTKKNCKSINPDKLFVSILIFILLCGHCSISSSPFSRLFWSDKVYAYSWRAYMPTQRTEMIKRAIHAYIPQNPEVVLSTQNTVNWFLLADRQYNILFPAGVISPYYSIDWSNRTLADLWLYIIDGSRSATKEISVRADFVVLDMKRPWFVLDQGCDWIYGECKNGKVANDFLDAVQYSKSHYETIFDQDGFLILKRRAG